MRRGLFITFEGGEGAGKSTQVRALAARLRQAGREVVETREPGGSPGAEALRELVVTGDRDRWTPLAELLIMNAARDDHLQRTVRPALARGAVVVSDRFADSSRAYQGAGGGVDAAVVAALEGAVVASDAPDVTLMLDLPVEAGLARAARRGGHDRFEGKGLAFHQRLRDAFLAIAALEPRRCLVLDGELPVEALSAAVWAAVEPRLIEAAA